MLIFFALDSSTIRSGSNLPETLPISKKNLKAPTCSFASESAVEAVLDRQPAVTVLSSTPALTFDQRTNVNQD